MPFGILTRSAAPSQNRPSGFRILNRGAFGLGTAETIGAPRPLQADEFTPATSALRKFSPILPLTPLGTGAGTLDLLQTAFAPVSAGIEQTTRAVQGRPLLPARSAIRGGLSGFPEDDRTTAAVRSGLELGAFNVAARPVVGAARATGQAIARRVAPVLSRQRILATPVEELIRSAQSSGTEGARILRVLRNAKSPKFGPVFRVLGAQRAPQAVRLLPNLAGQRGAVLVPQPGDFVRFGNQVRKVVSVNPQTQQAILAVGVGKTITAPLRALRFEPGGQFRTVTPETFIAARSKTTRPQFLSNLTPEELQSSKRFLSPDGKVGYGITTQGELVNVFNNGGPPKAGSLAVRHAISNGARTLTAFDGFLREFYEKNGFRVVKTVPFDNALAPPNWDLIRDGRPDILLMELGELPHVPNQRIPVRVVPESPTGISSGVSRPAPVGEQFAPAERPGVARPAQGIAGRPVGAYPHVGRPRLTVSPAPKTLTISQRVALRRSLTGQGRAFQAGEQRGAISAEQPLALRSLRRQGQAFAAGEQRGADTQKAQLLDAFRQQSSDIRTIQQGLIQRIRERVPVPKRGQFLNMVTQAQTKRQVVKAFQRIEREATSATKRQLIGEVKDKLDKLMDSPSIAIEFRQQIKGLANTIRLTGKMPATIRRLEATRNFLERQAQLGKDVELPRRVLESLRTLDQADAASLSVGQLEELSRTIDDLARLGATKQTARDTLYRVEKDRKLADLTADTVPLERNPMIQREVGGEALSLTEQTQNLIRSTLNALQHVDLSIAPMDVLFDLLDGGKGYAGANVRIFKKAIDADFNYYLDLKDDWTRPIQDLAVQLGLQEANMERIAIHAYRAQPNGVNYLLNSGLTQQQIDAVRLTPNELRWYTEARRIIEEPFPQVKDWLRVNTNRAVEKVPNYWPVQTDFEKMSEVEVSERLGDALEGFGRQKNAEQGFTLRRVGGKQPIRLNAIDTFVRHMDDVAYLLAAGRDIRMLAEIARSPQYAESTGELGQKIVLDWTDTLARKGGADQAGRIAKLDWLRRNFGASTLGFKLSSILIQPTALFDGAAFLGPGVFPSFSQVIVDRNIRTLIRDLSGELRNRGADDPAYLDLSDNPVLEKWQRRGFWLLQQADLYTASGVWWEAYKQAAQRLGTEVSGRNLVKIPEAAREADLMLRRTQASAFFKDVPQALSRGRLTGNRSVDRAVLQFRSFILNRWSLIRHDAWRMGIRQGVLERDPAKVAQGAKMVFWLTLATVAETGIRSGTKVAQALVVGGLAAAALQADEEQKDFTQELSVELLGNVPFVSDFAALAGRRSSTPVPLLSAPIKLAQGVGQAFTGKAPATRTKGAVRALEGFGAITGLPGISMAGQLIRQGIDASEAARKAAARRFTRPRRPARPPRSTGGRAGPAPVRESGFRILQER